MHQSIKLLALTGLDSASELEPIEDIRCKVFAFRSLLLTREKADEGGPRQPEKRVDVFTCRKIVKGTTGRGSYLILFSIGVSSVVEHGNATVIFSSVCL